MWPSLCRPWQLVMRSMQRCLWSPPDADLMDLLLYDCDKIQEHSGRQRKRFLRQHARALNTAYLQVGGWCPAAGTASIAM